MVKDLFEVELGDAFNQCVIRLGSQNVEPCIVFVVVKIAKFLLDDVFFPSRVKSRDQLAVPDKFLVVLFCIPYELSSFIFAYIVVHAFTTLNLLLLLSHARDDLLAFLFQGFLLVTLGGVLDRH